MSRIYQLREQKNAANQLLQKGSIAETTWQQILAAEAELNLEVSDMASEARALGGEEWGQNILHHANEYVQKAMILKVLEKSGEMAKKERERWEVEKAYRKEQQDKQRKLALKELTEENSAKPVNGGEVNQVEGEIPNGNTDTPSKSKKKKNKK